MHVTADIVEAAKRGEPEAFEEIVRRTHRPVYALVYRIVGNHDDAADVTQEAYVRAWRSLRRFRGDADVATWLHRIASNAALTFVRRRGREGIATEPEQLAAVAGAAPDDEDARLGAGEVERALGRLPAGQRAVVVLKDVYGWSCAEIASELGATEGAVKVRLFRARQRLADELARDGVVVPIARGKKRRSTS